MIFYLPKGNIISFGVGIAYYSIRQSRAKVGNKLIVPTPFIVLLTADVWGLVGTKRINMKKTFLFAVMLLTSITLFGQSVPQDLLTSDPAWNSQIQMLIHQYGVAKTREIVNEYRRQQQGQQVQSDQKSSSASVVKGMAANGQVVFLKVSYPNNGYNATPFVESIRIGEAANLPIYDTHWQPVRKFASKTSVTFDKSIAKDFAYKISIGGMGGTVYF